MKNHLMVLFALSIITAGRVTNSTSTSSSNHLLQQSSLPVQTSTVQAPTTSTLRQETTFGDKKPQYTVSYSLSGPGSVKIKVMTKDGNTLLQVAVGSVNFYTIIKNGDIVECGGSLGIGRCFNMPVTGQVSILPVTLYEKAKANSQSIKAVDGRTILGVQADCFDITTGEGVNTACIDPSSQAVLYFKSPDGLELTVDSFSTAVDDSIITSPFKVQDLKKVAEAG